MMYIHLLKQVEKAREASEGTFVPERHYDILNASLGKKEHPGRVRGVGSHVNVRSVYGPPNYTSRRSSGVVSVDEVREALSQEMNQKWQSKFDDLQAQFNLLADQMKIQSAHQPSTDHHVGDAFHTPTHSPLTGNPHSSCQSVGQLPFPVVEVKRELTWIYLNLIVLPAFFLMLLFQ